MLAMRWVSNETAWSFYWSKLNGIRCVCFIRHNIVRTPYFAMWWKSIVCSKRIFNSTHLSHTHSLWLHNVDLIYARVTGVRTRHYMIRWRFKLNWLKNRFRICQIQHYSILVTRTRQNLVTHRLAEFVKHHNFLH